MSIEELKKIENFDLERYRNDAAYRKYCEQARQIKANADEIKRSQQKTVNNTYGDIANNPKFTKVVEQQTVQQSKKPAESSADFSFSDFASVQEYDNNSPITKALTRDKNVPINSLWADRAQLKKYWATKKYIKIKIANEDRYNEYTFRSINDEQLKQLQQMAEDINNFYGLIALEKNQFEDIDGIKKPALLRNGRYYNKISDLQSDFRKAIGFICLGISEDEFNSLEQFSDPDYTINDIWGIYDLIDGIYERAIRGGTYFRIAFKP